MKTEEYIKKRLIRFRLEFKVILEEMNTEIKLGNFDTGQYETKLSLLHSKITLLEEILN